MTPRPSSLSFELIDIEDFSEYGRISIPSKITIEGSPAECWTDLLAGQEDAGEYLDEIFEWHGLSKNPKEPHRYTPNFIFKYPTEIEELPRSNSRIETVPFDPSWKKGIAFDITNQQVKVEPNTTQIAVQPHFFASNSTPPNFTLFSFFHHVGNRNSPAIRRMAFGVTAVPESLACDNLECNSINTWNYNDEKGDLECIECGFVCTWDRFETNVNQFTSEAEGIREGLENDTQINNPRSIEWWLYNFIKCGGIGNFLGHPSIPNQKLLDMYKILINDDSNRENLENHFYSNIDFFERFTKLMWKFQTHAHREKQYKQQSMIFDQIKIMLELDNMRQDSPEDRASKAYKRHKKQLYFQRLISYYQPGYVSIIDSPNSKTHKLAEAQPPRFNLIVFVGLYFLFAKNKAPKHEINEKKILISNQDLYEVHKKVIEEENWTNAHTIHTINFMIRYCLVEGFELNFQDDIDIEELQ
mgnify:CR=1 FL=1